MHIDGNMTLGEFFKRSKFPDTLTFYDSELAVWHPLSYVLAFLPMHKDMKVGLADLCSETFEQVSGFSDWLWQHFAVTPHFAEKELNYIENSTKNEEEEAEEKNPDGSAKRAGFGKSGSKTATKFDKEGELLNAAATLLTRKVSLLDRAIQDDDAGSPGSVGRKGSDPN
jgi:hypothetical protein